MAKVGARAERLEYQADRWLSVDKLQKVGPVIRFILESGDAIHGRSCATCSGILKSAEELVAAGAAFHHAKHFE